MTLLALGVVMGQGNKPGNKLASQGRHEKTPPTAPQTSGGVPDLRRTQLRLLRESTLLRVVGGVKEIDEAALRISARNQILMHLGGLKAGEEDKTLTAQIASDALTDFGEHGEEIPPFMADYLFNDLGAWIQRHQPKLAERLQAVEKNRKSEKESDRIRALLQTKGGDAPAAQRIRRLLAAGQEVDCVFFYLDALKRANSKEFEPLLAQIAGIAERGPQISLETLFWVSDFYLHPDTPASLKRRFLAAVISRTQPTSFAAEPAPQIAYDLLNKVLPFVRESAPELYDQAAAQGFRQV